VGNSIDEGLTRLEVRLFTDEPIREEELARLTSALRRKADALLITHTSAKMDQPSALDVVHPRRPHDGS
jgi:hypothetical protein